MDIREYIAEYPDFPKPGILFRDFSPLLRSPEAVSQVADEFEGHFCTKDFDVLAGIESRGFAVASILAARYGVGMVMIRKAGKLPGKTVGVSYSIEYGSDTVEIQEGSLSAGERVLICDDLLATGGTAAAAAELVKTVGGRVAGFAFIIELTELGGAARLGTDGANIKSLVRY